MFRFAFLATLAMFLTGAATENSISLIVGQTKVIPATGIREVALGDASIADVKTSGDKLLVTGLTRGSTNLTLLGANGRTEFFIRVMAEDPQALSRDVGALLEGIQGLKIKVVGDRVVLLGEIYKDEDAARIDAVRELFPQVVSLAQKKSINIDRMIQIDVKLMEVSTQAATNLGLRWGTALPVNATGTLGAPVAIGNGGINPWNGTVSIVSNFESVLQILDRDGLARLLSNPVLITKNGTSASFLAGGEVPIPVNQALGQTTIEWKKFGIILNFLPKVDPYGNVLLNIDAESSELDFAQGISQGGFNIPSLVTRHTKNEVNLVVGETLILAELMTNKNSKQVDKVPGLGSIPIIGELFKSRSFRDDETRFFVFVTPRIVKPGDTTDEKIRKQLKVYEDAGEEIGPKVLD